MKPWDDETDLAEMERLVRGIEMDGLVWGGAKQIPIVYGKVIMPFSFDIYCVQVSRSFRSSALLKI